MLGHLRTWGWLFNPLTLYFCFDPLGRRIECTVLEVSNTPWHERCSYVVGPPGEHRFAKQMHVSPFVAPEATYALHYAAPGDRLTLDLGVGTEEGGPPTLGASLSLHRRPLDRAAFSRLLWAYPLLTARISAGIYVQAMRLRAKGAAVYRHPTGAGALGIGDGRD